MVFLRSREKFLNGGKLIQSQSIGSNCCVVTLVFFLLFCSIAKLRKTIIGSVLSLCLSVRPSVLMEQFGSHSMDIHEISFCLHIIFIVTVSSIVGMFVYIFVMSNETDFNSF
jgi:hypothetical protein